MRNRFDEQLFELNREIIEMGSACENCLVDVYRALHTEDVELAITVRSNCGVIDQMERDVESRCMKLLLHQQPVARDLRLISSALKIITDMERIGDQIEDIAEIITFLKGHSLDGMDLIEEMANSTIRMVTNSVDAFVKKDMNMAQQVLRDDDIVDSYFKDVKSDIIGRIANNYSDGEVALDLLMIAKYLERIADHATNIAEWVIYVVSGIHKDA